MMTSWHADVTHITGPCEGDPPVTGGFSSQRDGNLEGVFMFSFAGLNMLLIKQPSYRWCVTPRNPYGVIVLLVLSVIGHHALVAISKLVSWCAIFKSSHRNSFEDLVPVNETLGYPIFKWIVVICHGWEGNSKLAPAMTNRRNVLVRMRKEENVMFHQ